MLSGSEQEMNRLLENPGHFSNLDSDSIEAINLFLGTEIPYNESEGGDIVCKAWDDHKESGRIEEIYSSVQDGDYTPARGAEKLCITVEEMEKRMEEAGYRFPIYK